MKKTKTQKGITLVALIITIVVLLILAMVSINSIQNEGVMKQAQNAAEKYNEEQAKEQNTLLDYEKWFDIYGGDAASYKAYSVGDSVTVQGEEFWVIQASGTSEANVMLLSKKAIDTTNLVQSSNATLIEFSASNYWLTSGGNITETLPIDQSHYVAYAAYRYGEKLGGTGSLLTANMASNLTSVPAVLTGASTWLGSVYDGSGNLYVLLGDGGFAGRYQPYTSTFGVRPVVTIAKDKVV